MLSLVIYAGYESSGIAEKIHINHVSGLCRFFSAMMLKFCVRATYVQCVKNIEFSQEIIENYSVDVKYTSWILILLFCSMWRCVGCHGDPPTPVFPCKTWR